MHTLITTTGICRNNVINLDRLWLWTGNHGLLGHGGAIQDGFQKLVFADLFF